MKKLYILVLLNLILLGGFGQEKKTLLWEISGNGLSKPSYLYGTIHQICKEKVVISSKFEKIIKSVDSVYLEINFNDELNEFKAHFDFFNKSGKKLNEYFTNQEYTTLEKKFNSYFKPYKVTLNQYSNFKPDEILYFIAPKLKYCIDDKWTSYEAEISIKILLMLFLMGIHKAISNRMFTKLPMAEKRGNQS